MRKIILFAVLLALVAMVPVPGHTAQSNGKLYGFAGVVKSDFAQMRSHGIRTNTATLNWDCNRPSTGASRPECVKDAPRYNAQGVRPLIIMDLLFFDVNRTAQSACAPWTMTLKPTWRRDVKRWLAQYGKYVNSRQIAGLILDSEVNNGCISPETLQRIAQFVRPLVPADVPLGIGEGMSTGAKPPLPWLPEEIETAWIYNYDDDALLNPGPTVAELEATLTPNQTYGLVPRSYRSFYEMSLGLHPVWKLAQAATAYAQYCAADFRCEGVVPFLWDTVNWSEVDGTGLLGADRMPGLWDAQAEASIILGVR